MFFVFYLDSICNKTCNNKYTYLAYRFHQLEPSLAPSRWLVSLPSSCKSYVHRWTILWFDPWITAMSSWQSEFWRTMPSPAKYRLGRLLQPTTCCFFNFCPLVIWQFCVCRQNRYAYIAYYYTYNTVNDVKFIYVALFHDEILRDQKMEELAWRDVAKILAIYSHDATIRRFWTILSTRGWSKQNITVRQRMRN